MKCTGFSTVSSKHADVISVRGTGVNSTFFDEIGCQMAIVQHNHGDYFVW